MPLTHNSETLVPSPEKMERHNRIAIENLRKIDKQLILKRQRLKKRAKEDAEKNREGGIKFYLSLIVRRINETL